MKKQATTIYEAEHKKLKQQKRSPQLQIGEEIRDLKIDLNINLFILGALLIIFNCAFIITAIMLAHWINLWWVWLLDFLLVVYCIVQSICNFIYHKRHYHFTLHKNCLVLNSMWYYNTIIDYKLINRIVTKIGFWDKAFGRKTCSISFYLSDEQRTKINLYFLKENPTKLYNELWAIINANNFK